MDRLLELIEALPAGAMADLLDDLSPDELLVLSDALGPTAYELEVARAETADPLAWAREQLPELVPIVPGPHHHAIAGLLGNAPAGVRAVVAAPRGSGKSTILLTLLPLVAAIRRSHRFAVIVRRTLEDATPVVFGLRTMLTNRPELINRYPWLRPVNRERGELHLASGMVIVARGSGSAIRGLNRQLPSSEIVRPDLVLGDDVEDDETARSQLQTDRLEDWTLGTIGQLAGPPGEDAENDGPLDLVIAGTTIEANSLVSRMLAGDRAFAAWQRLRFPASAVVGGDGAALDTAGEPVPIPVPAGTREGVRLALWPQGQPLTYLERLTDPLDPLFVGSIIYAREYDLRPVARTDVLFQLAHTRWTAGLATEFLAIQQGAAPDTLLGLENVCVAVDPALSKREAADFSAVAVVGLFRPAGQMPTGEPWPLSLAIPHVERRHVTPGELLEWVEEVAAVWQARVVFEAEGGFAASADELRRRGRVAVRPVTSGGADKRTRAVPLSIWHEARRVWVDEGLRRSEFDVEFHAFTGTGQEAHDDATDAVTYGAMYATSAWRRR